MSKLTSTLIAKVKAFAQAVEAVAAEQPVRVAPPARQTAPLNRQKTALQLASKAAAPKLQAKEVPTLKVEAPKPELSAGRLSVIRDYIDGKATYAEMADARFMYRVVAEEHAFQSARLVDLKERVNFLRGQEAVAMNAEIIATARLIANLANLRKHVIESAKKAA